MKLTILILGSSGFIGKNLISQFLDYDLICLDKIKSKNIEKKDNIKYIDSDILNLEKNILPNNDYIVINLMAELGSASLKINRRNNVDSLKKILKLISFNKTNCVGFIHFSSISASRAISAYGKTKLESENIIKNSTVPYIILRSEMIIGKGARSIEKLKFALNIFPFFALMPRGGFVKRFPVKIEYVCKVVSHIIERNFFHSKSYELVSEPILMRDLAKKYSNKIILPIPKFLLLFLAKALEKLFKNPPFTFDNAVGVCTDSEPGKNIITLDLINNS